MTIQTAVFVDLETGGLDSARHPIIQLSAVGVDWQTLEVLASLDRKVQFDPEACEPEALELNSYATTSWQDARPLSAVLQEFADLCRDHASVQLVSRAGKPYRVAQLVAYNAKFDAEFLQVAFRRAGLFLPASFLPLCTLQLAHWWFLDHPTVPQPADYKLASVCAALGIAGDGAHDATADNRMQLEIVRAIRTAGR